jgi:hypothetical protein
MIELEQHRYDAMGLQELQRLDACVCVCVWFALQIRRGPDLPSLTRVGGGFSTEVSVRQYYKRKRLLRLSLLHLPRSCSQQRYLIEKGVFPACEQYCAQ